MSRIAVPLLVVLMVIVGVGVAFYQFQNDTDLSDLDRTDIKTHEETTDVVKRTDALIPQSVKNSDNGIDEINGEGGANRDGKATGNVVVGRLVTSDGLPVAGVSARLISTKNNGVFASIRSTVDEPKTAITDDQGFFTIRDVKEGGPYRVEAWPAELRKATSALFQVEDGEKHDVGELVAAVGAVVEGIVLNEAKVPVPDARVTISISEPSDNEFVMLLGPGLRAGRAVVTNQAGRFRAAGLDSGQAHIYVRAAGYTPMEGLEVAVKNAKPVHDLVVQLSRGRHIEGNVQDSSGNSIANAKIKYHPVGTFPVLWEKNQDAQTVSDKDGNFVFTGVPDKEVSLTIIADGFMTFAKHRVAADQGHTAVVLEKAALVFGYSLTMADKAPISNFEVSSKLASSTFALRTPPKFQVKKGQEAADFLGKAASPGLFVIYGINRRTIDFSISAPGYARLDYKISKLLAGEEREVKTEMTVEVPFAGIVVDQDGDPVSGVSLTVRAQEDNGLAVGSDLLGLVGVDTVSGSSSVLGSSSKSSKTKSKSDGTFTFQGLTSGPHLLAVRHPSFLNQSKIEVELGVEQLVIDYVVKMLPGASITGVVYGPEGNPVAGAKVSLERKQEAKENDAPETFVSYSPNWKTSKISGQNGVYLIEGVKPGAYFVRAEIPSQKAAGNVLFLLAGDNKKQDGMLVHLEANKLAKEDINLLKKSRVYGRVRSAGQAIEGAVVRANEDRRQRFFGGGKTGTADDSGAFEIAGLKPGKKSLSLAIPGSPHTQSHSVELIEGQDLIVDFDVPSGSISGRVTDENGQGVPLVSVMVRRIREGDELEEMEQNRIAGITSFVALDVADGDGGAIRFASGSNVNSSSRTDKNGYYVVPYLEGGNYKVTVSKDGYSGGKLEQVEVVEGGAVKRADLQMEAACKLVVRASKSEAGTAWFNVNVLSVVKGAQANHKFFMAKGSADYERLKPGTYTVTCECGGEKKEQSVTLEVGDSKTIRFEF